jgi:adenylate cyclase
MTMAGVRRSVRECPPRRSANRPVSLQTRDDAAMSSGSADDRVAAEAAALFDAVLDPARGERTISPAQIEADGGLTVDETRLVVLNFGLPAPEPHQAYFTAAEADVLVRFGLLREIWPPELYLQIVRVYGQALAHIARTEVNLFRLYVEPNLRSASGGPVRAREAVQQAFGELLPLADPMLLGVHRRRVEHEVAQAVVREAESRTPEGVLPGAIEVTFLFCDLKDFSGYAETHGDVAAVDLVKRLTVVVTGELGHHGHVVKALGDGFMLSYPEPGEAVSACVRIIEQMRGGGAPGVHAGVHHGVVLYREGDYFGSAVNLAARLLGLAGRDELLASEAIVRATAGRFDWESRGSQDIRGFGEPVCVYRLRSALPD